jgi:periplasmic divalent cation tolerance protein
MCQVTTTIADRAGAEALARSAVEARLAACGQVVGPITSVYRWEGAVETAAEWMVVFKTTQAVAAALVDHVRARHPYRVPEVVVTPVVDGNPAYLAWVEGSTATRP